MRYEVRTHCTRPDGTSYQQKRRFKTLAAAVEWHTTVMSELRRGHQKSSAPPLTVQQAVEDWLSGQRLRETTMAAYVSALRPIVDALGDRPIGSITKTDIECVVQSLRTGTSVSGTWHAPQKLKGKTVRSVWTANTINPMLARMRAIIADLVAQGLLTRNPASLVKALHPVKPMFKTLEAEQIPVLLRATENHPFGIAWRLALLGLRRGEILALTWDCVDFRKNALLISQARIPTPGGSRVGPTKTVNSIRVLPMPADLAWALLRVQDRQAQLRERLGSQWPNSNMVVLGRDGQPPNPGTLTSTWKKTLRDAGLPHIRLHDARHSCATLMHLNGVPAVVVAAWLGHADPGFTLRTYTHSNPAALAEAAKFLDSVTQLIPSSEPGSVA
ncbi:Putative prophage phiRv2 integrase [Mycobacteroides salmoniphilum]|nr:Putative prophage phiRv2 integrase [Mycobacteroides salmoniphilum]